jgi:uncharacterized protein YjbJ (UPF0337 family)
MWREEWTGIVLPEIGNSSKVKIREKWGELTDDDLAAINGRREQLKGKLQERYGYARDQARKEVEDWCKANTDQI